MLRIFGSGTRLCDGLTRREVLRVGGLGFSGLTLSELLQRRAEAGEQGRGKSVIMIWMRGGPSHIDSFDMKPDAPAEIRGEFQPISTNVDGLQICELMPNLARMAHRYSVLRGIRSNDLGDHTPHYIVTGFPDRGKRPSLGSVVSYLRPRTDGIPPYVSLMYRDDGTHENATYTGPANHPFVPKGDAIKDLELKRGLTINRLRDRQRLLEQFDAIKATLDTEGPREPNPYVARALEMITSGRTRDALDLKNEPAKSRDRYDDYSENFLKARRLVEAGIPVVTLKVGDWDTHEKNFIDMRDQLPKLDRGFKALIDDLYDRGLDKDVAVVMWGEFGRAPKISRGDGRDHWPEAGAAVVAGGGFKSGQVIGDTDAHGGVSTGTPYTPANVLASLYRHLGIDPAQTIPDREQRPMSVLDDPHPVTELH